MVIDIDNEKDKMCIKAEVAEGDILTDIRLFPETVSVVFNLGCGVGWIENI